MTSGRGRRGPFRISVPSRSDPVLVPLVEGVGGPLGRHTDPGRTAPSWFSVERVLILLTVVAAVLAVLVKNPCRVEGWQSPDYFYRACYSDWAELFQSRGFGDGVLPFITPGALFEYPVLLGLLASGTALLVELFAGGAGTEARTLLYFDVNAVLLAGVWLLTVLATLRLSNRRPWDAAIVAASPVIVLAGTINWDLWAVLLATAGMLAFARDRPLLAGVLWGLGTAVKLYPVLLLGAVLVLALRTGRFRPLVLAAGGTAASWLAVNLPFLLRDPTGWAYFLTFSETRAAGFSSGWYVYNELAGVAGLAVLPPGVINGGAAALFLLACGGILVLTLRAARRPRFAQLALLIVGAFVLCNKVYSPQYALWLIPLLALAIPRWRVILLWQLVEVLHWWAVWLYLAGRTSGGPAEHNLGLGVYALAVAAHILSTVYVLAVVVSEIRSPEGDIVRRVGIDDPQGGPFNGSPDRPSRPAGAAVGDVPGSESGRAAGETDNATAGDASAREPAHAAPIVWQDREGISRLPAARSPGAGTASHPEPRGPSSPPAEESQ